MTDPLVFTERRTLSSPQHAPELEAVIAEGAYADAGLNGNLLRRDCRNVLPYSVRTRNEYRPQVIADDTTAAAAMIAGALASGQGSRRFGNVLRDFFHSTADQLLGHRNAYYEIVYGSGSGRGSSPPIGFRLLPVPSGTVGVRDGRYVQYVPAVHAEHPTELQGVGYIDLSAETLAGFRLDDALQEDVAASFSALASVEEPRHRYGRTTVRSGATVPSLSGATAAIGWNGNLQPLSFEQLRPYQVWRQLQCLAFKIKIRDSILACLNDVLDTVGHHLHFPMRIELHNVPRLQDVQAAKEDLQYGRRGLAELATWAASP